MAFRRSRSGSTSTQPDDAVLLDRVRAGDRDAYGQLYERHHLTARAFARGIVANGSDADDVVAEVFAATLSALEHGRGPVGSFVPYLMRSVRNESYRLNRRRRREPAEVVDDVDATRRSGQRDPFVGVDEASVVRVAFRSLPANLREVLWRTEVDDASPTEIAAQGSASPHAVAMMALRARQALGSAYLREHLAAESVQRGVSPACHEARPHLADFVRGSVGARRERRLEAHLETCQACAAARESLGRLNEHLRVIPFVPFGLGHLGPSSLGLKAQAMAWLSSSSSHVAAYGTIATTVLMPTVYDVPPPQASRDPAVIDVNEPVAAGLLPDVGESLVAVAPAQEPSTPAAAPDVAGRPEAVDWPSARSPRGGETPGAQGNAVSVTRTGPVAEPSLEQPGGRASGRRHGSGPGNGDRGSGLARADDGDDEHGDDKRGDEHGDKHDRRGGDRGSGRSGEGGRGGTSGDGSSGGSGGSGSSEGGSEGGGSGSDDGDGDGDEDDRGGGHGGGGHGNGGPGNSGSDGGGSGGDDDHDDDTDDDDDGVGQDAPADTAPPASTTTEPPDD